MRTLAALLALAATVLGCGGFGAAPAPTPQDCAQAFSAARCLAIVDKIAADTAVRRENIVRVEILPGPTPEIRDGIVILQGRSGGEPLDVRVTFADGAQETLMLGCLGISGSSDPWCMDEPSLGAGPRNALEGYRDVPEGSTPVPTIAPDAAAEARPLRVAKLDIPIDRVGDHEVVLGEATIPNGILTRASFALADDWPAGVTIVSGDIRLEVRSLDDGGVPLLNAYEHGWRPGTERVQAVLLFHVDRFDPGSVLTVVDVSVE